MAQGDMLQSFANDASLVLVGMRCAGKSSLASMAAKALRWQVVDEKMQFQKITGLSVAGYVEKHGVKAYCTREVQVLGSILSEHQRCCIIICSSGCVETQAGRDLLHQYLSIMPIIHVMRDMNVLRSYLESRWNGDVSNILHSQEPVYLSCSNLTFFNADIAAAEIDDVATPSSVFEAVTPISERPNSQTLSLKHVESDFVRFLGCIYGRTDRDYLPVDGTGHFFNYALELPFGDLKKSDIHLDFLASCADVLQIRTDTLLQGYLAQQNSTQTWWEYIMHQLAFVRRHVSQPILYHAIPVGGDLSTHGPNYFDLVQLGVRFGAELITLDLTQEQQWLEAVTRQKGCYTFIGWLHDPEPTKTGGWTGQSRVSWYEKAEHIGCDMVHITQPATAPLDNTLSVWFAKEMSLHGSIPISAYNTGRLGRPSQCLNRMLTVVRHPETLQHDCEIITISRAHAAAFELGSVEPLSYSVMGAEVRYSLAPTLQNCAFEAYGMLHTYSISQSESLDMLDTLIQNPYFGGVGLSSPFKTTVISRLSYMSSDARAIGAVNTIMPIRYWKEMNVASSGFSIAAQRQVAGPVQSLYGENTDWKGIQTSAQRYLSPANAITSLSTALVIGAGGMARAAIYAMMKAGMKHIFIYNRTQSKAIALADHFGTLCTEADNIEKKAPNRLQNMRITTLKSLNEPWPSQSRYPTVIINCSPIPGNRITVRPPAGIGPQPAVLIPDAWLKSPTGGVYMELAYNMITSSPELLRISREPNRGWIGVAGLEILFETACAQFEFWTGRRAPKHLMKERLGRHLVQMQQ